MLSETALFNYGDLTRTDWIELGLIHNFEQSLRNRKIPSDPRGGAQAPPRTARLSPRQSGSHCGERLVREPAAFYVRSRDHLDVVADDPDCYLP